MAMEDPAPRRRWLKPVLIISLMLNLVVAGAIGRAVYFHVTGDRAGWHGCKARATLAQFVATLPEARRRELEPVLAAEDESFKRLWAANRAARREVLDIVAEDPLDEAKFVSGMARFSTADAALVEGRVGKFRTIMARLTGEERRAFRAWKLEHSPWLRRPARNSESAPAE